ncbi:MAG: hypothetical protein Q7J54_00765 [Candidatus Woesearchaeota archaeon]|nr:hypothetical protein [Candidatus Woesearchaeota archaeon]
MIEKIAAAYLLSLLLTTNVNANIPKEDLKPDLEKTLDSALTSEGHSDIAFYYHEKGDYDLGLEEAKKAVKEAPTHYNYLLLSSMYFAKEDMINALNSLIAAYYYDQDDKHVKRALLKLKEIMGLDDSLFNRAIKVKFLELDRENDIFLQYDKFKDKFK